MSNDVTADPLLGRLARFTPTSTGIDRDAILFAAGRASAAPARQWKLATAALAMTQTAIVGVWLASIHLQSPPLAIDQPPPAREAPSESSYVNLVRLWERDVPPALEAVGDDFLPDHHVLSIASGRRALEID